ncbi:phospholipase D-like domain-containing protein [Novosphingobium sp. 11B]
MPELEPTHLKSIIAGISGNDDALHEEIATKLTGENLHRFSEHTFSIIGDRSIPLVNDQGDLRPEAKAAAETIVQAFGRPVFVIADNKVTEEFAGPSSKVWRDRIVSSRDIINAAIPAIGRVEVNNNPDFAWVGTGWLIDSDIIVTNRHVAVEFGRRDSGRFVFRTGLNGAPMVPRIDFLEEFQRSAAAEFSVIEILWISPTDGPDVAFLRVVRQAGQPALAQPLILATAIAVDDVVAAIGYPARDPRIPDQGLVKQIFGDIYDKKRLAPGRILATGDDELEHDCTTTGGCSGAALLNLISGEVAGLHFAGLFKEANYAVPAPQLKRLLADAKRGNLDAAPRVNTAASAPAPGNLPITAVPVVMSGPVGTTMRLTVTVPLEISVRIAGDGTAQIPTVVGGATAATAASGTVKAAVSLAATDLAAEPGVLDIRAGYRFKNGWITDEQVVVVELREKLAPALLASECRRPIPSAYLGVGVDVRTAPLTDQLSALGIDQALTEALPRPGQYREPPDLSLDRVQNEAMRAIFHVSPDSGFPNLKAFISRVQTKLTGTIYEWDPNHISNALATALADGGTSLKMVTQKAGTERAVEAMQDRLGDRFEHVWASVGRRGLIPSAYHIKVASRDGEEFWLSSGNWKDSNQADIDPAGENSKNPAPLQERNREWHAIIAHCGLARTFRDYIDWDFSEAERIPLEEGLAVELPDLFVPEVAFFEEARRRPVQYFDPLELNRVIDIQPLLTPDRDKRGKHLFIQAATQIVGEAEDSVLVENQSFNILSENLDEFDHFFETLRDKQKDGLDVRIIFRDGREFGAATGRKQQPLLEQIKKFGFDMSKLKLQLRCHTKGIIVDGKTVLFGSHNLTNQGALLNRDASLLIRDQEVATYFQRIFNFDWDNLAHQNAEEVVGGIRIAQPGEETPLGFRRVSRAELAEALL